MRTFAAAVTTHLALSTTSLVRVLKITLRSGITTETGESVIYITDCDRDLIVSSQTYRAAIGFTASAVQFRTDLSSTTSEIQILAANSGAAGLTLADLRKGILRGATYELRLVNFNTLTTLTSIIKRGWIGKVSPGQVDATVELKGFHDLLGRKLGGVVSQNCPFDLGDADCQANLNYITVTSTVQQVVSNRFFEINPAGLNGEADYYTGGLVTWLAVSPNAANERQRPAEVKKYGTSTSGGLASIELFESMPDTIGVGDVVQIRPGCDKTIDTCRDKFANAIHFGGFPFLKSDAAYMYGKGGIPNAN